MPNPAGGVGAGGRRIQKMMTRPIVNTYVIKVTIFLASSL